MSTSQTAHHHHRNWHQLATPGEKLWLPYNCTLERGQAARRNLGCCSRPALRDDFKTSHLWCLSEAALHPGQTSPTLPCQQAKALTCHDHLQQQEGNSLSTAHSTPDPSASTDKSRHPTALSSGKGLTPNPFPTHPRTPKQQQLFVTVNMGWLQTGILPRKCSIAYSHSTELLKPRLSSEARLIDRLERDTALAPIITFSRTIPGGRCSTRPRDLGGFYKHYNTPVE